MIRRLLLIFALTFTTVIGTTFSTPSAAALDVGDIFTPTPGDYSIYIISKIFGDVEQSVLPGEAAASGPQLLGNVFRVFNVVALSLGVLMVIYTLVLAVLNTAHHGKMMGEKMSSMWVPVRIAFAIAMLIPKANGYCMAQVCVMWLVVQGIGAADTIWSTALDYFEEGGAVGGEQLTEGDIQDGLLAVYENNGMLEGILRAVTCVSAHNRTQSIQEPYTVYTYIKGSEHYLNFGRKLPQGTVPGTNGQEGFECGQMAFNEFTAGDFGGTTSSNQDVTDMVNLANATQMSIGYYFAEKLWSLAPAIADGTVDMAYLNREFEIMKNASLSYVTDMTSNQQVFTPPASSQDEVMAMMRGQGWITAGNYYQLLTQFQANYTYLPDSTNTPAMSKGEEDRDSYKEALQRSEDIYKAYMNWDGRNYTAQKTPSQQARESVDAAYASQAPIFAEIGFTAATANQFSKFMEMIGGENGGATDPILNAAHYGQYLMRVSVGVMFGLAISIPAIGVALGFIPFFDLGSSVMTSLIFSVMPIVMGLMGFMYVQGAMLGVYLPMVPFIIFAIGAIGWVLAVVESMVAAPLVALGMTLPEGHEIYGRAEPAYMMLINLFLRPALMILGFVSALLVAWLAVDLINLTFYTALRFGGIAPDALSGPYIVGLLYMGVLVALVTKVFGLINQVPDKVLRWIGDNTQAVGGAEAELGAAKQGTQEGAQQTGKSGAEGGELAKKSAKPALQLGNAMGRKGAEARKQTGGRFGTQAHDDAAKTYDKMPDHHNR